MENKILIEVRDGNIVGIYSNEEIDITIVDWDNISCGDTPECNLIPDGTVQDFINNLDIEIRENWEVAEFLKKQ